MVGCNNNVYYWEFNYSYEEVDQIKIIEMIDDLDYREIQEIDLSLCEQIYNDIMNIEMKRYGTNLSSPSGKCFLIVFENGEYDIYPKKNQSILNIMVRIFYPTILGYIAMKMNLMN